MTYQALASLCQVHAADLSAKARAYLSRYLAFGNPWDQAKSLRYQRLARAAYTMARAKVAAL